MPIDSTGNLTHPDSRNLPPSLKQPPYSTQRWQAAEDWWLAFAESSDGKFWGKRPDYPRYDEVSEQDVRRWVPAFNEILGYG